MAMLFAHDISLAGQVYRAARGNGGARNTTLEYIPQIAGQNKSPQLNPMNAVTWHKGSGATRRVTNGMYGWGKNVWAQDAGMVLPGPLVTMQALPVVDNMGVFSWLDFNGDVYFASGQHLYRVTGGQGAIDVAAVLPSGATPPNGLVAFRNGFYMMGNGGTIFYITTGGVSSGAVVRGHSTTVWWNLDGINAQKLVSVIPPNGVQWVDESLEPLLPGNWNPNTPLITGPYPITHLLSTNDHVYITTTGGILDLGQDGRAPNLTPFIADAVHPWNGLAAMVHDGWLYYGWMGGLLRLRITNQYQYAVTQDVTPHRFLPDESPIKGVPTAITYHNGYVVLAQWDQNSGVPGGTSYVSWGRDAGSNEAGPMTWFCSPIVLEGYVVQSLHVSMTVTDNPRLWMGLGDSAGLRSVAWAPLPVSTPYRDLLENKPYRFNPSFSLYESFEDWGDDSLPKIVPEIAVEVENLGPAASLKFAARSDNEPVFTSLGTLEWGPRAILTPIRTLQGSTFQLRIDGIGQPITPPILRRRSLRAIGQPDRREVRHYQLVLGPAIRSMGGGLDMEQPETHLNVLRQLLKGGPVSMRDEAGRQLVVQLTDMGPVQEADISDRGQNERTLLVAIELAVMNQVGSPASYDGAASYDSPLWRYD